MAPALFQEFRGAELISQPFTVCPLQSPLRCSMSLPWEVDDRGRNVVTIIHKKEFGQEQSLVTLDL
jgi:hypothetical protein